MTIFSCKKCGAPAGPTAPGGAPAPTCTCASGFVANLTAHAKGQSSVGTK